MDPPCSMWGCYWQPHWDWLLLSAYFTAIGLYFSVQNENPGIVATGSYGLLLLISLLEQNTEGGSFIH
ncbi:MAG: hypothetical protein KZQ60_02270 [Candidatus Thiodiazotropha sp. (ex Lucinoma aequizonata)]|nr:hypothetical protein [Candidatus Thiodiazotropha sp. (ex Lucinoma aequizonata)]MCU7914196.1 hypothetical protein [Candidatus Thiodiazotropha sp. (ex Lucinoma aequizonata)]